MAYTQVAAIGEDGKFGQILSSVDSHQGPVVENVNAMCIGRGD